MSVKTFIDSNILIYAHDTDAGSKYHQAAEIMESLWDNHLGVLSPQVLQEFYVNVTRKIASPLPRRTARAIVEMYQSWCVDITHAELMAAFRIEDATRIGFWDALIVASALRAGAHRVLSEDLNPGQKILGLQIENPFKIR
jgi:predicted nucleic acid-binding protein